MGFPFFFLNPLPGLPLVSKNGESTQLARFRPLCYLPLFRVKSLYFEGVGTE